MKNRVPKYPGRVILTPVPGQANTYDLTRADAPTEAGDPLNKETFFTDRTAGLYPGLDGDSTPNDAFAFLGGYTQWRWIRRTVRWTTEEALRERCALTDTMENGKQVPLQWSASIHIDVLTGVISLQNPSTIYVTSASNLSSLMEAVRGNYVMYDNKAYRISEDAEFYFGQYVIPTGPVYVAVYEAYEAAPTPQYGPWEEVRASTDDAYPDNGVLGGYEYQAQGMPLEKAAALSPEGGSVGGGTGESWKVGSGLTLSSNVLRVDAAETVSEGDARPVTAGAVFAALGDVGALLDAVNGEVV